MFAHTIKFYVFSDDCVCSVREAYYLIPNVEALIKAMWEKVIAWVDVVKIGRTHLQDAISLTVGQEWSGYVTQLKDSLEVIKRSMRDLYKVSGCKHLQTFVIVVDVNCWEKDL
jgi:fumarate hydratase class II